MTIRQETTRWLAAAAMMALAVAAPLAGSDPDPEAWPDPNGWPEYGGDGSRAGASPIQGPTLAREAAPTTAAQTSYFGAPIVDLDRNVYVASDEGVVTKFAPRLGTVWQTGPLDGSVRSSLALDASQRLYVTPVGTKMYAIDAETGQTLWTVNVNNDAESGFVITAAPLVHPDGLVIQPAMDGKVYAIQPGPESASVAWTFDTTVDGADKLVGAASVAPDGTIYVGGQNGYVYALTPAGGLKWKAQTNQLEGPLFPNEQIVASASVGPDGTVYVPTRLQNGLAGSVYAYRDGGSAAELLWSRQLNEKITAPVAVSGSALYVGDIGGTFYRISAGDGTIAWQFEAASDDPTLNDEIQEHTLDTRTLSVAELAIVANNGLVYVSYWHVDLTQGFPPQESFKSPFYALKTSDGSIQWRDILPKTMRSPALAPAGDLGHELARTGILYVAGDDGKLRAYGDEDTQAPAEPIPTLSTTRPPESTTSTAPNATSPSSSPPPGKSPGPGWLIAGGAAIAVAVVGRRNRAP